jgi:hypothetical protein
MRFLTAAECDAWVSSAPVQTPEYLSIALPPESGRLLCAARIVAYRPAFRERCLLRVKEWDIWPSSNNWHLYYQLRRSLGDNRTIDEAPGHLFLEHEMEDLATYLHLAMLFGWDAELRPDAPYISGLLSHDGFLDLYADDRKLLVDFHETFEGAKFSTRWRP